MRISGPFFSFRVEFSTFLDAFLFSNYLRRCIESFTEERNSLNAKLTKNVEMIFHPKYSQHYVQTIVSILEQKNAIEPGHNSIYSLKIELLTATLEELLIGAFSMPKVMENLVKEVVFYVNFMLMERVQFLLRGEVQPALTQQLLTFIWNHDQTLNRFNIVDKRFEIIFQHLLLIHKKVLFNELTNELNIILCQMSPAYSHREETVKDVRPLSAFIEVIRKFLAAFAPFKEQICFNATLLDAFRKFYYYFFNYFRFLFEKRIIDFDFENTVSMLDELAVMIRETERIVSEANIKFQKFMGTVPELTYFKRLTAPISTLLLINLRKKMLNAVESALKDYEFGKFDLVQIVTGPLSGIHSKISQISIASSLSAVKLFLGAIIETAVTWMSKNEKLCANSAELASLLSIMKRSFEEQMDDQESAVFSDFFTNLSEFLTEKRRFRCEVLLTKIIAATYDGMTPEIIQPILTLKSYTDLKFNRDDLDKFVVSLRKDQDLGQNSIELKKEKRKASIARLFAFRASALMLIHLRELRSARSEYVMSEIENNEAQNSLVQKFDIGVLRNFSENFKKFVTKRQQFSLETVETWLDSLASFSTVKIVLRNLCLNEHVGKEELTSLQAIYLPCKIIDLRLIRIKGVALISFQYCTEEVICLYYEDQSNVERVFGALERVVSAFKRTVMNTKR